MTRWWARAAAVLASAGLYCAAFPPWNVSSLSWVALVPFLLALRGSSASGTAATGFLWGTAVLSGIGGWSGIGVAGDISGEDPTAALGATGAFADVGNFSNQGGVLTVFALP